MGRGQYDRAAARAKRDGAAYGIGTQFGYPETQGTHQTPNSIDVIADAHGNLVSQADYDALVVERDKLLRLCKTHGLFV